MSGRSRVLVLAAVFFLFASVGLMSLQMSLQPASIGRILATALLSGGFAVGYAILLLTRRINYMALLGAAQVLTEWQRVKHFPRGESLTARPEALHAQLAILAVCATMGIIAAYSLLIHFFRIEGRQYYHVHAEMALASEIHRSLVPVCQATVGGFEIYGASVASGEVGGDLVDFVEQPSGWTGYVADVSGHGVQSGVLMAMFKTAMRSHVLVGNSPSKLLNEVQQTIFPLKLSSMFVTAGVLQSDNAGRIVFASAGHPPILHYQETGNAVSELSALDPQSEYSRTRVFPNLQSSVMQETSL